MLLESSNQYFQFDKIQWFHEHRLNKSMLETKFQYCPLVFFRSKSQPESSISIPLKNFIRSQYLSVSLSLPLFPLLINLVLISIVILLNSAIISLYYMQDFLGRSLKSSCRCLFFDITSIIFFHYLINSHRCVI